MDANQEKLMEMGIDVNTVVTRVMRSSIQDDMLLMNAGISIKTMLKAGICPCTFLAGGVNAIPAEQLKTAGVNKNALSDEDLKKLGLNSAKLHSKGNPEFKCCEWGEPCELGCPFFSTSFKFPVSFGRFPKLPVTFT